MPTRDAPVEGLVAVTVAPGTRLPCASFTVPDSAAVPACAYANECPPSVTTKRTAAVTFHRLAEPLTIHLRCVEWCGGRPPRTGGSPGRPEYMPIGDGVWDEKARPNGRSEADPWA